MQMDLAGFAISAGSACSSGKVRESSRVLRAMGYDETEVAKSAIRVSAWARQQPMDEIYRFRQSLARSIWTRHRARAA